VKTVLLKSQSFQHSYAKEQSILQRLLALRTIEMSLLQQACDMTSAGFLNEYSTVKA
jgi:hypothetical protein